MPGSYKAWLSSSIIAARDRLTHSTATYTLVDGKRYGLPYDGDTHVLFYNTAILERNGQKPPTTWDELKTTAQALKDAGVAAPIVLGAKDWVHPYFMYIGLTSSVLRPEGLQEVREGTRVLNDAEAVTATQLLLGPVARGMTVSLASAPGEGGPR